MVSLRWKFAATFAGNALFAASQWAVLSLIAKLGSSEMLGQYALAVAVATPVVLFSHLNLRVVVATDMARQHPFGDYLAVRVWTTVAALLILVGVTLWAGYARPVAIAIWLAGVVTSADNLSDIYYGAMQRRERMDQIAVSTVARGLVSLAALGVVLWLTRSLVAAMAAQAVGRIAVLSVYDHRKGTAGESMSQTGLRPQASILRTALPLGIVLLLVSLTTNLPRYSIERHLGLAELGAFAAVASFLTAGSTVVNALGQTATPRLAMYFSQGDRRGFRRLSLRLIGVALLLGMSGLAGAAVFGEWLLRLVYRPAYAAYAGLLLWIMGAASLNYVAGTLGYVVTSTRAFTVQAPLFAAVAATAGILSAIWIPMTGLKGAAWALAAAWMVQITGELWILRKGLAA